MKDIISIFLQCDEQKMPSHLSPCATPCLCKFERLMTSRRSKSSERKLSWHKVAMTRKRQVKTNWFISQHGQSTMRSVPRVRLELSKRKKTCRKVSRESIGVNLRYLLKWRNCTKSKTCQAARLPCMPVNLRFPSYTVKPLDICELTMGVTRRQHRTRPSPLPPELGRGHSLRCINKTFWPHNVNNYACLTKYGPHYHPTTVYERAMCVFRPRW